jgi:hypothetical protein
MPKTPKISLRATVGSIYGQLITVIINVKHEPRAHDRPVGHQHHRASRVVSYAPYEDPCGCGNMVNYSFTRFLLLRCRIHPPRCAPTTGCSSRAAGAVARVWPRTLDRHRRVRGGQQVRFPPRRVEMGVRYAPAWYQRASSSGDGSPKKPPTSAPVKGMPESERVSRRRVGRCSHDALLSPVQTAPKRCEPRKNARESRKGRSSPPSRWLIPAKVALACSAPYALWTSRCSIRSTPSPSAAGVDALLSPMWRSSTTTPAVLWLLFRYVVILLNEIYQ